MAKEISLGQKNRGCEANDGSVHLHVRFDRVESRGIERRFQRNYCHFAAFPPGKVSKRQQKLFLPNERFSYCDFFLKILTGGFQRFILQSETFQRFAGHLNEHLHHATRETKSNVSLRSVPVEFSFL